MKRFPGFLICWLTIEATVTLGPGFASIFVPFPVTGWLVLLCCAWAAGWSLMFTRMSQRQLLIRWQNDCLVFAEFAKQFRNSDPILANAMWQKIHPNIPPPWLAKAATVGGKEDR